MEEIALLVYGRGRREVEVAEELGVSRQAVNKALKEARGRLAEMFLSLAEILDADIVKVDVKRGYAVLRLRQLGEKAYVVYVPQKGPRILFERGVELEGGRASYQEVVEAALKWGLIREAKDLGKALRELIAMMES